MVGALTSVSRRAACQKRARFKTYSRQPPKRSSRSTFAFAQAHFRASDCAHELFFVSKTLFAATTADVAAVADCGGDNERAGDDDDEQIASTSEIASTSDIGATDDATIMTKKEEKSTSEVVRPVQLYQLVSCKSLRGAERRDTRDADF